MPAPLTRSATAALFASEILAWATFSRRLTARSLALASLFLGAAAVAWFYGRRVSRLQGVQAPAQGLPGLALALAPSWLLYLDCFPSGILWRDPSRLLLSLTLAGILFLMAANVGRALRRTPLTAASLAPPPAESKRPRRRAALSVFLAGLAAYTALIFGGLAPAMPFTGDEPHYLLMARSIVCDGDLNLYEDYLQKRYLEFYPGELSAHGYSNQQRPSRLYSKHMPALPLLIAPAYWCADRLEALFPALRTGADPRRNLKILLAREAMAILAALLATVFFITVWDFSGRRSLAIGSWIFFAFTLPVVAYARLLLTEIPAALILLLVLRRAALGKPASWKSLAGAGVGIALLPWFGIKYIVPAAATLLVVLAHAWRTAAVRKADLLRLLVPLLVSGALFAAYLRHGFGSVSPFAVYQGLTPAPALPAIHGLRLRPWSFLSTALAYFLDQRIGLFIYSPLTMLCIPGAILWFKKARRSCTALLVVATATWAFFALINFRQGHCPPGRELLPILPLLAMFAAGTRAWAKSRAAAAVARILAIFSLLVTFWGVSRPGLLYHTGLSSETWNADTHSYMLAEVSNAGVDFTRWLPNLISRPDFSWSILAIWLAALAGLSLAILGRRTRAARQPTPARGTGEMFFVLALSLLLVIHHSVDFRLEGDHAMAVGSATVYFQDDGVYGSEGGGFWTKGDMRTALVVCAPQPLHRLRLDLSSPTPLHVSLQVGRRQYQPQSRFPGRFGAALDVSPGPGRRWERNHLYWVTFRVRGGFIPAEREAGSKDRRFLGIFVHLAAE